MSKLKDLADDVKGYLNGLSLSKSFVAVVEYRPRYDVKNLSGLIVVVVPFEFKDEPISRDTIQRTIGIDIWVAAKIDTTDNSTIDEYVVLVEEITEAIEFTAFSSGINTYSWVLSEIPSLPDRDMLDQYRVFSTVISNTFITGV